MASEPKDPWSVVTSVAYPAAGVWALRAGPTAEAIVLEIALTLLFIGTALHHWSGLSDPAGQDLDHAGMNGTYLAVAAAPLAGPAGMVTAGAAGVGIALLDYPNRSLMGGCVVLAFIAGLANGQVSLAIAGLALMGMGLLFQPGTDMEHGLGWHLLTALGTPALFLAAVA